MSSTSRSAFSDDARAPEAHDDAELSTAVPSLQTSSLAVSMSSAGLLSPLSPDALAAVRAAELQMHTVTHSLPSEGDEDGSEDAIYADARERRATVDMIRAIAEQREQGPATGSSAAPNATSPGGAPRVPTTLRVRTSSTPAWSASVAGMRTPPHVALPTPASATPSALHLHPARGVGGVHLHAPSGRDVLAPRTHAVFARGGEVHSLPAAAIEIEEVDVTSPDAFQRVNLTGRMYLTSETVAACTALSGALALRDGHAHRKPEYYWGACQREAYPTTPLSRCGPREAGRVHVGGAPRATPPPHAGTDGHASATHAPVVARADSEPGLGRAMFPPTGPQLMHARTDAMPYGPGSLAVHQHHVGASPHIQAPPPTPTPTHVTSPTHPHVPVPLDPATGLVLTGSRLVTWETGKEYGNLFYRRRPEPVYTPFTPLDTSEVAFTCACVEGVMHVYDPSTGGKENLFPVPTWHDFYRDYIKLLNVVHDPIVKQFAYRRLELLQARFHLHRQANSDVEVAESKAVPHRDFYNVRKVDTHVHHSACMNAKHLLRFIKHKLKICPDEVVLQKDGVNLTLAQVFESLHLTAYDLSIDTLATHADASTFHRFDRFNLKYNPVGAPRLREIFLKTDNFIKGKYLAEVTKQVFDDLESAKYTLAEYRVSIYGKSPDEWSTLAAWVVDNGLASPNVRWMIQIPRLYEVYRATGGITCFADMLRNIFMPLFEVTARPASNPKLHTFLSMVVGFDAVDDESRQEAHVGDEVSNPDEWSHTYQPPYFYWTYYLSANLAALNNFRSARGMTQFSYRPHAGEAGDVEHLAATFLTAESINHGINLRKSPVLQYLYYLAQIGLAVSPLSNNKLFLEYAKSPFYEFFAKGLNVSLSTDDPLMLALTREPLIEEYCVAAQVWKLSNVDMCEIARMSVLQSGFEYPFKAHFIGANYAELGPAGNDIHMTNVPYIRLQYRLELLESEHAMLAEGAAAGQAASTSASMHVVPVQRIHVPAHGDTHLHTSRARAESTSAVPDAHAAMSAGASTGMFTIGSLAALSPQAATRGQHHGSATDHHTAAAAAGHASATAGAARDTRAVPPTDASAL